jgi:hypothetical protein
MTSDKTMASYPAPVGATRLGLVFAPELPAELAEELAQRLPTLLQQRLGVQTEVLLGDEPQLGDENSAEQIAGAAAELKREHGWDAVLCLTDVPLRSGVHPLVAAASARDGIAVISVPAFGMTRLRHRVREAAVWLTAEITSQGRHPMSAKPLTRRRLGDVPAPIRHVTAAGEPLPTQFVTPPVLGHLRLLSGMVRANRPWRAMSGLATAVVAAVATGAYASLNNVIWMLGEALSPLRLAVVMCVALASIITYLIISHHLWQRRDTMQPNKDRALYNAATVLTLLSAVLCGYLMLFATLLLGSFLVVDTHVFELQALHSVDAFSYLRLAWLSASLAALAGALGSGLESIEEVREAAYGHNQRRRVG